MDAVERYEAMFDEIVTLKNTINQQQAEIERLQKKIAYLKNINKEHDEHLHVRLVDEATSKAYENFIKVFKRVANSITNTVTGEISYYRLSPAQLDEILERLERMR